MNKIDCVFGTNQIMNQVSLFKKYIKNMVLFENLDPARLTVDGFE